MTGAIKDLAVSIKEKEMPGQPTVSASYAKTLIDFAATKGGDPAELYARSAITPEDLVDPDHRVPLPKLKALVRAAQEVCNDPAFALHFGASPILYETTVVGLIIRSSATMGEAFAQFARFARVVMEVDTDDSSERFVIVREGELISIEDRRRNPNDFPEITEATWARIMCESARLFPDRAFVKEVHVTHAPPLHRAEYERVLKAPVIFGGDRNALLFDPAWLTARMPSADRYKLGIFSAYAEQLLGRLESARSIRASVERLLIPVLHKGDVRMATIAAEMSMSAPTLYRKLREEGVNYESLLDELRRKMALDYLSGRKVSVNETAYLVGFSDPAAFSRAFKRWTGKSPRTLRREGNGSGRAARSVVQPGAE